MDSTARIIDNMILTRIKDRYRLYYLYMVTTPSQSYVEYGKNNGMIPEYDAYTSPTLGRTRTATSGSPRRKSTRRHLNDIANGEYLAAATLTSIPGVLKVKFMCKLMKYLVQTGVATQFASNKLNDVADADDNNKAEVRREATVAATDFLRKAIAGAFAIRSYDYFRVNPPPRDDHLHIDPVSLTCAVTERVRTFAVMVTLNKVGVGLPAGLEKVWESKLKSSRQSEVQLENSMCTFVMAITNTPGEPTQDSGAAASSKDTSKRRRK